MVTAVVGVEASASAQASVVAGTLPAWAGSTVSAAGVAAAAVVVVGEEAGAVLAAVEAEGRASV